MDPKGYYSTLGISESATEDEIKTAYKKLSLKYHPDKQVGKSDAEKSEAEAKFKAINEAYSVLSDQTKKQNYDSSGDPERSYSGGFGSGFNGGGFNSGFNPFDFFGGFAGMSADDMMPQDGTDIKMQIPLTIEEIYTGCTKKVRYDRKVRCSNCHGAGGLNMKTCPHCHGTGRVEKRHMTPFGVVAEQHPCMHCHGTGKIAEKTCPTCGGTGFKTESTTIEVNFPPGMMNGFSIKFTGKGNESKSVKGRNGDFFAEAIYKFDANRYEVNGLDIIEKVYIPYYDILLGSTYDLELPDHTKKKIIIPACAPEGKLLRLIGDGIKTKSSTGNYYIEIHYLIPEKLSEDEKKALMKIKVKNIEQRTK